MGEPLNNYTALVEAIRVMTAPPFQLSPKRITVSTVMRFTNLHQCIVSFFIFIFGTTICYIYDKPMLI
jgi:adenine C2-methylase RlmN of 23S rRNA A2503 and tRNA A37